ncbi:hypothetical protein LTR02_003810 [Friedmanniomyces endolithicus]|uniref:Uncharacterized protein n=1 Tax=Friedmanniomyces endolithicus TaxID=329885 RepID=A0A4U0VH54_9PEZI|nr:hypothetical protein LTS09_006387 [Friedmanniomyces endolithicus]KAK0343357.1 hypothetical protein LTR94_018638 [Friedmanniomyces endolithicus]KAK0775417.1 hypothetical protein LTR59_014534 [Friedmanniomyces endolithicus]KAK0779784.1 hypothetical protein LTR38_014300 [Friedmanniomyces endolithicus]KAK0782889.1 hypothetical protein LTR75_014273 [Friedmanniomyces endolithicus]
MAIEHASEEKSMHFFRFPQELRDRIYNCLTHNLKKPEVGPGAQKLGAIIRNAPIQRLLVLSKRFKYKYEMEVQRTMTLVISDDRSAPVLPILLGSLSRILRHVEVRMVEILGPGLLSASADDVGNAITKLQHRGVNMIKTVWLTGQLDRVEFKYWMIPEAHSYHHWRQGTSEDRLQDFFAKPQLVVFEKMLAKVEPPAFTAIACGEAWPVVAGRPKRLKASWTMVEVWAP